MARPSETVGAYLLLAVMPIFFSSNLVLGRAAVETVAPFTLAFFRWFVACLILAPFVAGAVRALLTDLTARHRLLLVQGFLGMWICGAIVYLALAHTTATNATLIYAASPIFILVIEFARGRRPRLLELAGILAAVLGIATIVLRGDPAALTALTFNPGDLGILFCAFAWAVYSVVLRASAFKGLPTLPLFWAIMAAGSLILAPFMVAESVALGRFPSSGVEWLSILGLAIFPSLVAFSLYQYGVKVVGPSVTGVFLYFLPVWGVAMAVLFLGEEVRAHHLVGMALVTLGVALATLPRELVERLIRRREKT